MKLAEEIVVNIGGEAIELRPSLRLALQLERRPGGFAKVLREITDLTLGTMAELIEPHHGGGSVFINQVYDEGLPNLRDPLLRYVLALAGIDPEQAEKVANSKGKTVPMGAHLLDLYRCGTGWLGWTPADTLDATPTEIVEAFRGRQDMLRAIFGSSKDDKPKDDRPLNEKFRSIFAGVGTIKEPAA